MPDRSTEKTGTVSRPQVLLLGLTFCLSRLVILPFPQPTSDVAIYARYAHEYAASARAGVPFYEFHAQAIQEQIDTARAAGRLAGPMDEYKDVEYPLSRLPSCGCRDSGCAGILATDP
jgi:hypothetical protein